MFCDRPGGVGKQQGPGCVAAAQCLRHVESLECDDDMSRRSEARRSEKAGCLTGTTRSPAPNTEPAQLRRNALQLLTLMHARVRRRTTRDLRQRRPLTNLLRAHTYTCALAQYAHAGAHANVYHECVNIDTVMADCDLRSCCAFT